MSWAPWASCFLILRSLVLGPAPQKSCAGHSAESSETCGRASVRQWPHHRPLVSATGLQPPFQAGKGPQGVHAPRLGVCEMRACKEPRPWNQKGQWEERDRAQSIALQGPQLEEPQFEGEDAELPSGSPSLRRHSPVITKIPGDSGGRRE